MWGPIIAAGANIASGIMSRNAQKEANEASAAAAQKNRQMQMQFAEHGIRMRVADAKKAGIHPIYALGAQTPSYTPVSQTFTPETGLAAGLANAGQDISRAFQATRTAPERADAYTSAVQKITLENMGLDTEIKRADLASKVARLAQSDNPAIPAGPGGLIGEDLSPDKRPVGLVGGKRIWTDPNTSNVDDFWTKRYGEPGEWVGAAAVGWQDFAHNFRNMSVLELLKSLDNATAIYGPRK